VRMTPAQALEHLEVLAAPCILCERRCGAMRSDDELGHCGLGASAHVYNRLLHFGEEAPLVPSYAIFLTGCSMACSFCSEAAHLRPPFDAPVTDPEVLAMKVALDLTAGASEAKNINFVGGEPSISMPFIARFAVALDKLLEERPPLLLNTNGYLTPEALALATHLFDIWVVDLKFGDDRCAGRIADTPLYLDTLKRNLGWLHDGHEGGSQTLGVPVLPVNLWVRHLLMPGHRTCCTEPVLTWTAERLPLAHLNVMTAFHPFGLPDNDRWRSLSEQDRTSARSLLLEKGHSEAYFDGRRCLRP